MNGFGFNSNGFVRQFLDKPITTYTHTTNKEVVISAVDVDTDTFTSVAHGLANGDRLFAIMNYDAGNIYPADKYATGAITGYVVNKTDNTFQLSASSGGVAQNITANANLDLTKWHFEKNPSNITISNLPPSAKYKLLIKGRTLAAGPAYLLVNDITVNSEWGITGGTTYGVPGLSTSGDIYISAEILIDYTDFLSISGKGKTVSNNTSSAFTSASHDKMMVSPKYRDGLITAFTLSGWYVANGLVVEVYRA